MKKFPESPDNILIRSTNWIGDAIMTTPAVRTIRKNFPDADITLLALPWVADVFAACPHIDHIFLYDKKGRHQGLKGKFRLAADLRKRDFAMTVLLQNAFEAALITTLAGIPVRAGYTTDGRGILLSHGVRRHADIGQRHQVHYYQEMLQGLGLQAGPDALELFLEPGAVQEADRLLKEKLQGRDIPIIGLNPGAAYGPAKRWPAAKYGKLAARLAAETDALILVFGTRADQDAAAEISAAAGDNVLDLTGKTSLAQAMACIDRCRVFVTNDSGLMHVAAALHTPLVAVFGSTDHIATGPYSEQATVIRKSLDCSPCMKTHCPKEHFQCMEQITVDEVAAAALRFVL
jgi:heptosyltransferase-2